MIYALTGHRPQKLGGFTDAVYDRLLETATQAYRKYKPTLVISGMALGWDMAGAEAAYLMNIPWHAYVPFKGQEITWPCPTRKLYTGLITVADKVIYCATPGYAPWKMHNRNECMVNAADAVLALWDGGKSGGTASCVDYATRKHKTVINLWESFNAN